MKCTAAGSRTGRPSMPERYARGYATLITQHETEQEEDGEE